MKTLILALAFLATTFAGGCTRNTYRSTLTKAYPDCEWVSIGQDSTKFILRKPNGSVWEIEMNSITAKVWSEAQLFKPTVAVSTEKP